MPCKFSEFGCPLLLKKDKLRPHQKKCVHRTFPCLVDRCKEICSIRSYIDHLKKKHSKKRPNATFRSDNQVNLQIDGLQKFQTGWRKERRERGSETILFVIRYDILKHDNQQFLVETKFYQDNDDYEDETVSLEFRTHILTVGEEADNYRVYIKVSNSQKVNLHYTNSGRLKMVFS